MISSESIECQYSDKKEMCMNSFDISDKASEISTTRPRAWEYSLLAQVMCDEIDRHREKFQKITLNNTEPPQSFFIDSSDSLNIYIKWLQSKLSELEGLAIRFSTLITDNDVAAFGPPGQAGNSELIIQVARQAGNLYASAIDFLSEVRSHRWEFSQAVLSKMFEESCTGIFIKLRDNLISEGISVIRFYERFGPEVLRRIQQSIDKALPGESLDLDLFMTFEIKVEMNGEFERAILIMEKFTADAEAVAKFHEREDGEITPYRNPNSGYIYLLMNESMPGLFKIGKTTRTTEQRVKELDSATGVPTSFLVIYEMFVEDCHVAEKYVHERLDKYRVSERREFFKLASSTAIEIMLEAKILYSEKFAT